MRTLETSGECCITIYHVHSVNGSSIMYKTGVNPSDEDNIP